jgi:hypothetical protein
MKKHKKIIFIVVAAVLVIGATLGAVAFAQADDQSGNTTNTNTTNLLDKVAAIYQQLTGTAIDSAQLQKAFDQARQEQADQALDNMLQKLVASGKITQAQADAYKTWVNSKPATTFTDEYKQWMQSKPEGVPFGAGGHMPALPRLGGFGKMFGR